MSGGPVPCRKALHCWDLDPGRDFLGKVDAKTSFSTDFFYTAVAN
jgi:hypothetical protein